tara:strand:+ start:834 stop:1046 length:213 start_codon:yes stop_codon:yes gene_type:complete
MRFQRLVHEAQTIVLIYALKYVTQHVYGIFSGEKTPEEFVARNMQALLITGILYALALVMALLVFLQVSA